MFTKRVLVLLSLIVIFAACSTAKMRSSRSSKNPSNDQQNNQGLGITEDADAAAIPTQVIPILECVIIDDDAGKVTAHFGYRNDTGSSKSIPVGSENFFSPDPEDRGQPERFDIGQTASWPDNSFSVDFRVGDTITWNLDGNSVSASDESPECVYRVFIEKLWEVEGSDIQVLPSNITGDFELRATSDLGTATCNYKSGNPNIECSYENNSGSATRGLLVAPGGSYVVSESNLPDGWTQKSGIGTYKVDEYCELGVNDAPYACKHSVVNATDETVIPETPTVDSDKIASNSFWGAFLGSVAGVAATELVIYLVKKFWYGGIWGPSYYGYQDPGGYYDPYSQGIYGYQPTYGQGWGDTSYSYGSTYSQYGSTDPYASGYSPYGSSYNPYGTTGYAPYGTSGYGYDPYGSSYNPYGTTGYAPYGTTYGYSPYGTTGYPY